MKAMLKRLSGDVAVDTLTVDGGNVMIGRASDCDYQLESPLVSRHHCELILEGTRLLVRDIGSRDGTFVNGQEVAGMRLLQDGDVLCVAPCLFQVHLLASGLERAWELCAFARSLWKRDEAHVKELVCRQHPPPF